MASFDVPEKVVVHPLVLLSAVDHFSRVSKSNKRVVGVLLGKRTGNQVDILNSYAVPFEEDKKNPKIWFFDHNYHENMFSMFKKVNAREKVIGWYSTGPKIRQADIEINEVIRRYTSQPIFCIIDVNPKDDLEIPTQAYVAVPDISDTKTQQNFVHVPSEIGALEAEEVGVEHLLRDIRDTTVSTLSDHVNQKIASLKGLKKRMDTMADYLKKVAAGKLPLNHQIIYNLQDIFNLCPNLQVKELVSALKVNTNDNMLVIYIASLIRSIIALHNLINNKLKNEALEKAKRLKDEKKDLAKDKKDEAEKQPESKAEKDAEGKDAAASK
uniref:MPN domain-containing protein n=1 Tax=Lotharella globosa TaxID=91324 RepID=A0A6V3RF85_9EUKA